MYLEVKVNGALPELFEKSIAVVNRLSNRVSAAEFDIIAEDVWATPSLAIVPAPATGGVITPAIRDSIEINAVNGEDTDLSPSLAIMPVAVALGGRIAPIISCFFAGKVAKIEHRLIGVRKVFRCKGQDWNAELKRKLVNKSYRSKTEKYIIDDLFSTYWSDINTSTYVVDPGETITSIDFTRISLDDALEQLAENYNREWYIDTEKKLHYFTAGTDTAPFGLSDAPDMSTSFPYYNLVHNKDATKLCNRVTVMGGDSEIIKPVTAKYNDVSAPSFTSYLSEVTDDDEATHLPADAMPTDDYIYIRSDYPFSLIDILMGANKNSNAATLSAEYSKSGGSWGTLYTVDETGALFISGKVAFNIPSDWVEVTVDGENGYFVRLSVSEALSATVDIAEIRVNKVITKTVTDAASYSKYGEYFDGKVVDRNIDNEEWATLVGEAHLAQYADVKEFGSLDYNQEGAEVGQQIKIINSLRGIDAFYIVRAVTTKMAGGDTEDIHIEYGDYQPGLIDLLKAIKGQENREN